MANISEYFKKLGAGKTAVLLGVAAMAVAGIIVFLLMTQGPAYQVLYAQLSPEDSGAVIDKLKDRRIPYSVSGSSISVPADKVYEVRMELAGEGIPQGGGVGFEIFDNSSFGITDFVQKVNYKRALQGELARTISQIKAVDTARVHLAIPDKSVFLDEQKGSRASIILKLKSGKTLTQGQVSAIVHLVANSFENLKTEDVTIVDTSGRMWTTGDGEDDAMRLSTAQLGYKRTLEKDLETRVQSMLEKALGGGKVVARVSADVENRHVERTEETFNPDGQVVRSEQRTKDNSVGGLTVAAGVPGVLSNLPGGAKAAGKQAPPRSNSQNEVINYEISKVVSHVVEPVGGIKRLTVAVLIDGSYEMIKGDDGKEIRKYSARSEEEIAKYTQMVKSAVGFDQTRGDAITVVSTPFETDSLDFANMEPEAAPLIPPQFIPVIIKYASAALVALFAIVFLLRPIIKRLTQEKEALEAIQNTLPGGLQASLGHGGERAFEAGEGRVEDDSIEKLKEVVKNNPQQVAMVLKSWIKEKR
ncbi:MAG: flagellar basal-body MS-ring/collar protein FliF [Thermodesulfobacteriota bacterium]